MHTKLLNAAQLQLVLLSSAQFACSVLFAAQFKSMCSIEQPLRSLQPYNPYQLLQPLEPLIPLVINILTRRYTIRHRVRAGLAYHIPPCSITFPIRPYAHSNCCADIDIESAPAGTNHCCRQPFYATLYTVNFYYTNGSNGINGCNGWCGLCGWCGCFYIQKNKKRRYLSTCALFQRAADGSRTHVLSLEG